MATIYGANTLSSAYDVANSCRFNSADSASLKDGDGSAPAGNRQKFTFSVWFKRAKLEMLRFPGKELFSFDLAICSMTPISLNRVIKVTSLSSKSCIQVLKKF